jgi:MFS family permease
MNSSQESPKKEYTVSRAQANFILITCFLLFAINFMDKQVFSVVLEPMRIDLGLNDSQVGIIQSIFYFSLAIFAIPAAFLVDRWSRKKAISLMAIFWSVATLLTGLGRGFWGVLFPRIGVGVGEAAFGGGGTAMVSAAYPPALRSRVVGLFFMAVPVGSALGAVLGGWLSANYGGWRTPFFVFAIPGIIFGIAALFMKDYKTVKETDASGKTKGFFSSAFGLFKIPSLRWAYIGIGMQQILQVSFLTWTPTFIMRAQGVSEAQAGLITAAVGILAIAGIPIGGLLADLWQKRNSSGRMNVMVISSAIAAVLFALAVYYDFKDVGFAFGLLMGFLVPMANPLVNAVSQDVVSPGLKGVAGASVVFYMVVFGGGWAPWAVGAISDSMGGGVSGIKLALLIASLGGLLAALCFWISKRHYADDMKKVEGLVLEAD